MALKIQDFIDVEQFQMLQDRLNEIYSFPSAIIDNDGNVLTATAWQDVCTKFHRQNEGCNKECVKSDQYIASHLHEANPAVSYRCPHGLIDNATPIIIEGVHYGNYFTGQFFLEPPNLNFFRGQAKRYGFDEEAYIEAIKKVPIWTQEQLDSYLFFIKGLIEVISTIGLKNLKEIETRKRMQESEEQQRAILQTAMDGFWLVDMQGRLLEVNETYCRMSGFSEQELLATRISDLEATEAEDDTAAHIQKVMARGEDRFESKHRRKDGSTFDVEVSVQYRSTDGGRIVTFLRDITERKQTEKAIRESQELFKVITSNSPDHLLVQDSDLRYSFVMNPQMGLTQQDMIGKTDYDFLLKEEADKLTEIKRKVMKTGLAAHMEVPLTSSIGGKQFFEGAYIPKFDVNGQIDGLIGYFRNVTDRKREQEQERRTREIAERLAQETTILATIGIVISSTPDIGSVYERFAIEAQKLIPFDRITVNLQNVDDKIRTNAYMFGTDIPGLKQGISLPMSGSVNEIITLTRKGLILQSMTDEEMSTRFPTLNLAVRSGLRSMLWVPLISGNLVIGALSFQSKKPDAYTDQDLRLAERIGTQIAGAIANAQLLMELKKAEVTLRDSEDRYRSLFARAGDGIFLQGITGFLDCNEKGASMYGLRREDVIGCSLMELSPERQPDGRLSVEVAAGKIEAAFNGEPQNFEWQALRADGVPLDVEITLNRVEMGGSFQLLAIVRDITDRKRMEAERKNLEDRLQRAEKMEALGQLAGGVAHDLNNVLGILSGYSELLLEEIPEGSRSKGYVEKILQSTEKGAAIIQDLLTLARRGVAVSDVINLNRIVSGFLKTPVFESMKDYHPRVTFKAECDKNLLNIKGSSIHLEKTLMNLASNAAESISGEGEVTIQTENRYLDTPIRGYDEVKPGDYVILTVSDTGMGIPAENREKIFEPFYTKKAMGRRGTGLGLAIVWGTVKDHNGYIDLQTEVGKGTAFTLYFPVTREEMSAPPQKEPMERYMGQGESVLVVDDIAEQRDVASSLLTRLGYNVHAVAGGKEAVDYLKGNKADILVLDMIMAPGIDGLETYQRVLEINPRQKAILVSGFSETKRVKEAQRLGAGAYVKKPYVMEKIGMAIWNELGRRL